ncbi:hypothetical protein [Streptomyces sp. NPDC001135]
MDPDLTDPTLPDTEQAAELTMEDAGIYLADAAAWNLWPIMLMGRERQMSVTVTANGVDVQVPGPDTDATLAFFSEAYRQVIDGSGEMLMCGNPKKQLGFFSSQFTYGAVVGSPAARELGLEGAPHHICLLRGPELVSRYHSGPERLAPDSGYVGVFKVTDDLDGTFARAEPPSHDAWEYQQLKGREATFVRTAGRRLKERCDVLSGAQARRAVKVGQYAMGSVAQRLGHLLAGPGGTGTAVLHQISPHGTGFVGPDGGGPLPTGNSGESDQGARFNGRDVAEPGSVSAPSTPRTRRPTLTGTPMFDVMSGRPVVVQRVQLHGPSYAEALVRVLTGDGSTENETPTGAAVPTVLGWRSADSKFVPGEVLYHSGGATEVEVVITAVADVLIDISVVGRS